MRIAGLITGASIALSAVTASAQVDISAPGTVVHSAAGARFPEQVGDFQRANVHQFDPDGIDLSASYVLARGEDRVIVTVYVYPAARLGSDGSAAERCEREFEGVGDAIEAHHGDARLAEQGPAPAIAGVEPALGRRAVYRMTAPFNGRPQPVRSEAYLYCFVDGDWLVKYRATSNEAFDASSDVEDFIRSGPWPGRGPAPDPGKIAALGTGTARIAL